MFLIGNDDLETCAVDFCRSGCLRDERKVRDQFTAPPKIAGDFDACIFRVLLFDRLGCMLKKSRCFVQMQLRLAASRDG